jgi:hypothetical protein
VKRVSTLRTAGKTAGAVILGLIAIDLLATLVTLAFGVEFLRK